MLKSWTVHEIIKLYKAPCTLLKITKKKTLENRYFSLIHIFKFCIRLFFLIFPNYQCVFKKLILAYDFRVNMSSLLGHLCDEPTKLYYKHFSIEPYGALTTNAFTLDSIILDFAVPHLLFHPRRVYRYRWKLTNCLAIDQFNMY